MNDETLRELWDAEVMVTPANRGSCPSPEEILDAVEGHGRGAGRDRVLLHLSRCTTCREEAGVVAALLAAGGPQGSTATGEAASAAAGQSTPIRPRILPRNTLSVAASLVLVAGGVGAAWWAAGGDGDAVRGGDGELGAPEVTCPVPGSASIRWAGVEGVRDYRVELFADDGTVLIERVVSGLEAAAVVPLGGVAAAFGPEAGPVLARVEARFQDGRATGSPTSRLPQACRPEP